MFGFGVGIQRLGSFGVPTRADLLALPAPGAGLRPTGFVFADTDEAKNGVYTWSGSAWTRQRALPEQITTLTVTGGTADAITAAAPAGTEVSNLVAVFITPTATNTGPVTVNGAAVTDAFGDPLSAGEFVAGKTYMMLVVAGAYRAIVGEYATASQGAKADSAVQPGASLIAAIEAAIPLLPTDLPSSSGKLWLNGGLVSVS